MAELPKLARALKAYRARHGLSQSRLAELWGRPVATVREWEQARGGTSSMADVLADRLDEL